MFWIMCYKFQIVLENCSLSRYCYCAMDYFCVEGIRCNVNVVGCASWLFVEFALSLCLCFLLEVCDIKF
jgi:hypothetical protein